MIKIAPSILSADFSCLRSELEKIEKAGADMVHLDVMDGHFVPPITIGAIVVDALRPHTKLPFDAHLMVSNPDRHIESFAEAGADSITIHAEVAPDLNASLARIRSLGVRVGVSINPETDEKVVLDILDKVDMVLVMTVRPGYGGQKYIEGMESKVRNIREAANRLNLPLDIQVDGGINTETIKKVVSAGANVIVTGSAFFNSKDPAEFVSMLRRAVME
ncbi:ribulose-phosphate 3-epimerase [Thermoclostridium caenicola]|uniref:Ribulose-phosphate 3-epimerase n=1 Tax=Thermoclostridium caenicola TaxID=659425 RepID=A0A1M6IVS1_9FIRM|nr:ribulose-phosphate 3-epimerase [Thermoclostridium caenicola]SHJ38553.1 ribulose-5-phosphate 3-epimerase [Thermoclostridium caenicola]